MERLLELLDDLFPVFIVLVVLVTLIGIAIFVPPSPINNKPEIITINGCQYARGGNYLTHLGNCTNAIHHPQ